DIIDENIITPELKGDIQLSADIQDVSVLIFGKENQQYKYQKMIHINWPEETTTSTNLILGDYKFLFLSADELNTDILPATLSMETQIEEIRVSAKKDESDDEYVYPVGEIFMPETEALAQTVYAIRGNELIENKLTHAVSQITLKVKRGIWDNEQLVDSLPYSSGQNILDLIDKIEMDIK
ncbi:MAG: hypothetical protein LIO93_10375, partial [Bacteroidales bacterium]|nr:hypothetical protein [Bacteroidales bacterium]